MSPFLRVSYIKKLQFNRTQDENIVEVEIFDCHLWPQNSECELSLFIFLLSAALPTI